MSDFHPFSFLIGAVSGAIAMTVVFLIVLVKLHANSRDLPEPQDWSRRAR